MSMPKRKIQRKFPALLVCVVLLLSLSSSAFAVEFPDVSLEHWAHADIVKASDYGLVQGLEDGTFQPEETLNRASFVTILQRMFHWTPVVPATPSYSDVSPDDWYYSAVETAKANGVIDEISVFQPMGYITREDMAVMLVRALGYESLAQDLAGNEIPFPDVTSHPGHIAVAAAFGMTTGVEVDGQLLFQPNSFATRGQAAAMLVRVYDRYRSKIDFINGFYAFASYSQIDLTSKMDAVSVGWSRLSCNLERGPWLNTTSEAGNDWVKPQDSSIATDYFRLNGTPYLLNVFADTTQNVALSGEEKTSVLELVLPDPTQRATAVAAIAAAAPEYAGITIDFEGLRTDKLRADFISFMTELRAALPAGKLLYVCIPPDQWYQGYDFRALGEICDKLIYMVHDYQWTSVDASYLGTTRAIDPGSPVTPFVSVYQALQSITDPETGVRDRSKIALQISFGSAGFLVDENGGLLDTTIYHPAQDTIAKRLGQADTVVNYDDHIRNPMMRYTGDEGDQFVLWYEDARSVSDKLDLARMFGITGISIWRLGNIPNYSDPTLHYDVWSAIMSQR